MSFRRLASEVLRNLWARPSLSVTVMLVAALVGLSATVWSTTEASRIQAEWDVQVRAGAFTLRAVDAFGDPLDATRCDEISQIDGVEHAGAVLSDLVYGVVGQPSRQVFVSEVTPGYIPVAFPGEADVEGPGVLFGREVAETLGILPHDEVTLVARGSEHKSTLPVDRIATTASRIPGSGSSVFVAMQASGTTSECLVQADPEAVDAVAIVLEGWFDGRVMVVAPVWPGDDTRFDPEEALDFRATRFAGLIAGLALLVLLGLTWVVRRSEFALYRLLGLGTRDVVAMGAFETLLLAAAPFTASVGVTAMAYSNSMVPLAFETLSRDLAGVYPVLLLAPLVVLGLIRLVRPMLVLREG